MTPLQGMLGGKGTARMAMIQAAAYRNASNPHLNGLLQARPQDMMLAQLQMQTAMTNAQIAPPDTLASWFSRLERRANQLIDDGEFMDTIEWMRWREELDRWQEQPSTPPKIPK